MSQLMKLSSCPSDSPTEAQTVPSQMNKQNEQKINEEKMNEQKMNELKIYGESSSTSQHLEKYLSRQTSEEENRECLR